MLRKTGGGMLMANGMKVPKSKVFSVIFFPSLRYQFFCPKRYWENYSGGY